MLSFNTDFETDIDGDISTFDSNFSQIEVLDLDAFTASSVSDLSLALLSNGVRASAVTKTTVSDGSQIVEIRGFNTDGSTAFTQTISTSLSLDETHDPSIVAFDGGFAVAYVARPFSFIASQDVFVNVYDNAGNFVRQFNASNPSLSLSFIDDGSNDSDPHLAVGADGTLVVTYTRNNDGVSDQMVYVDSG